MFSCMPFSKQIDYLDKRQCNLTQIPEDILRYTRCLEELLLDSNHIKELSKPLFRFHKLRRLALSDNEISKLPADISQLPNLIELDLSRNDISEIPDSLKLCKNLQYLDLTNNPLNSFPICVTQLITLTHLGLNDLSLIELPSEIGRLINLHVLELRDNLINALPLSIAALTKLKVLDLGTNEFEVLSPEIGKLTDLLELYLDGNSIEHLPKDISSLQQLISLDVAENKLLTLPEELGELKNLSDLTISQNCLESLPHSIGKLKKLSILKADKNRLVHLTPAIGSCVSMSDLILSENLLTDLPSSIGNLKELSILNIDKNRLKELPCTIGCCVNLTVLSLRDNLINSLVDELGKLEKLRVLGVSGNRLHYLPYTLNNLKHLQALWLSDNQTQPLLKLQTDTDQRTGVKVLTCYLLPQHDAREDSTRFLPVQPSSNGPSIQSSSFAGGPKVHFPDVDQDSCEEQEPPVGKFERHDTPHPKHGPKPKGRQIDGHVIHHGEDQAQIQNRGDQSKDHDMSNKIEADSTAQRQESRSPTVRSVGFMDDPVNHSPLNDSGSSENRLHRKNTPHPLKGSTISPDVSTLHDKVACILNRVAHREETTINENYAGSCQNERINIIVRKVDDEVLGLSIAGGRGSTPFKESDAGIFVSKITENGIAAKAGLKVGDKLITVNGRDVTDIEHNECVEMMKPESILNLNILREIPRQRSSSFHETAVAHEFTGSNDHENRCRTPVKWETLATIVKRDHNSLFGFSIMKENYIVVANIDPEGAADRDGKLKIGDKVLSINGVNVRHSSQEEAQELVDSSKEEVHLIVQHPIYTIPTRSQSSNDKPFTDQSNVKTTSFDSRSESAVSAALACGDKNTTYTDPKLPLAQSSPIAHSYQSNSIFIVEEVKLIKGNGPLGLSVVGGVDHSSHPFGVDEPGIFISKVEPLGAADRTGRLRIGDRILCVNDFDISKATHKEAVAALISQQDEISLVVRHDPQPKGLKEILINKSNDERLGINICGGLATPVNPLDTSDEGIFVSKIVEDGAVYRDGRLRVGDRILEVNNKSVLGSSQSQAADLLRQPTNCIQLLVCDGYNADQIGSPTMSTDISQESNYSSKNVFKEYIEGDKVVNIIRPEISANTRPLVSLDTKNVTSDQYFAHRVDKSPVVHKFLPSKKQHPTELSYKTQSATSLLLDQPSPSKRVVGMPVPKPYVSREIPSTPPRPIVLTPSRSTSHISAAAPLVQENGYAKVDFGKASYTILPAVPPKTTTEKFSGSLDEEQKVLATDGKEKDHVLIESKIPSATRNSKTKVTATTSSPLTPTSESHPEKLTFTRKIEKFQQEIVNQSSLVDKSKLPTLNKIPQSFVEKSDAPVNDNRNGVKQEQAKQVNDSTVCNNSPSSSAIPSIVRTKKAENRLKSQHTSGDSPDLGESLSPAELRALEAAKRAEWRKARLKSLERDALKAEKVMSRVRDFSQEKDDDGNEDLDADNVELDYIDRSSHLVANKPS